MDEKNGRDKVNEVKIDSDSKSAVGRNEWMDALRDLEGFTSPPPASKPPAAPVRVTAAPKTPGRPTAPPPQRATPDLLLANILSRVQATREELTAFVAKRPGLIAPNIHNMLDDHLKETGFTMTREKARADGNASSDGGVS